ncbi:uncharacterized protein TNCV_5071311 [Trichonephila clavipes]|nr:uncharacterized protein TNCV_5071311 [Trichonephila clavipes]
MACERKFNESEATTGFFLLLGQQGNKAVLDWVMKEGLIPSRYECPKCKKDMRLVERKGTIDGFEWCCRVQSKENPHFVCRSWQNKIDSSLTVYVRNEQERRSESAGKKKYQDPHPKLWEYGLWNERERFYWPSQEFR